MTFEHRDEDKSCSACWEWLNERLKECGSEKEWWWESDSETMWKRFLSIDMKTKVVQCVQSEWMRECNWSNDQLINWWNDQVIKWSGANDQVLFRHFYIFADCFLLGEALHEFRSQCFKNYRIFPDSYLSLPAFSLDACLKFSGTSLELIHDKGPCH